MLFLLYKRLGEKNGLFKLNPEMKILPRFFESRNEDFTKILPRNYRKKAISLFCHFCENLFLYRQINPFLKIPSIVCLGPIVKSIISLTVSIIKASQSVLVHIKSLLLFFFFFAEKRAL